MSILPKNIEALARQIDGPAFEEPVLFAERYIARRRAMHMVEHNHMAAIMLLVFANLGKK